MEAVYDRCVIDAPDRLLREDAFTALRLFVSLARRQGIEGRLWISGNFVSRKPGTADISIALLPNDWAKLAQIEGDSRLHFHKLFTLTDVIVGTPYYLGQYRFQPMSGEIDAFLCHPDLESDIHEEWSAELDEFGEIMAGTDRGYLEVFL